MAVLCSPAAARAVARSSLLVPRGSTPSLDFRNVFVCCDQKTSEEFTMAVPGTPGRCLRLFAFLNRKPTGLKLASLSRVPSAKRWCAIASSDGFAKPYALLSIG
jgi:hypothetical protein